MSALGFKMAGLLGLPLPWGLGYSNGVTVLGDEAKQQLGLRSDPTYGYTEWRRIITRINGLPADTKSIVWGHSMGANMLPYIAAGVKRPIDLMIGFDPTVFYACPALPKNVKRAICIHSTNFFNPVGHALLTAQDSSATKLTTYNTGDEHTVLDDDLSLHKIALAAMKDVIAA